MDFKKKKGQKTAIFGVFFEIFFEFWIFRKKNWVGFSTDLWQKNFFLLKFFWGYLYDFWRPWKYYTVARTAARHIWDFEKVRCRKMGNFRIFFLKKSKYNLPHNYKFDKKFFYKLWSTICLKINFCMIYVHKAQDTKFWKKVFFKIWWNLGHFCNIVFFGRIKKSRAACARTYAAPK